MIHHTRGVYPNGDFKDNGVCCEDLAAHIQYNLRYRPGRALFVDGVCIYKGHGVSEDLIEKHEHPSQKRNMQKDTAPYV